MRLAGRKQRARAALGTGDLFGPSPWSHDPRNVPCTIHATEASRGMSGDTWRAKLVEQLTRKTVGLDVDQASRTHSQVAATRHMAAGAGSRDDPHRNRCAADRASGPAALRGDAATGCERRNCLTCWAIRVRATIRLSSTSSVGRAGGRWVPCDSGTGKCGEAGEPRGPAVPQQAGWDSRGCTVSLRHGLAVSEAMSGHPRPSWCWLATAATDAERRRMAAPAGGQGCRLGPEIPPC